MEHRQNDHRKKPPLHPKKKRPRKISIAEIKNDPLPAIDPNDGYITSEDEAPPADDGIKRVSWDEFMRFPEDEKSDEDEEEQSPSKKRKITFDKGLRRLKKYKKKHGNTDVPRGYGADPTFEAWLDQLRSKFYKKSKGVPTKLTDQQFAKLQRLGFQVSESKKKSVEFERRLLQLKRFKREFHHVKVPQGYTALKGLRAWVIRTRNQFREKEKGNPSDLTDEQIRALNDLGFFWNNRKRGNKETKTISTAKGKALDEPQSSKPDFAQRLEDLKIFKDSHKSSHVPKDYDGSPGLRDWTMGLRKQYWEMVGGCPSGLSDGQIHELNEIGFDWDEEEPTKEDSKRNTQHQQGEEQKPFHAHESINPSRESYDQSQADKHLKMAPTSAGKELFADQSVVNNSLNWAGSFAQKEPRPEHQQRQQNSVNSGLGTSSTSTVVHPSQGWAGRPEAMKPAEHRNSTAASLEHEVEKHRGVAECGGSAQDINHSEDLRIPKKPASKTACKIHINSWLARFKQLKEYKATHGHTNIPDQYPSDQHFADWLHEQQRDFNKRAKGEESALSDERFKALQELGFEAAPAKVDPPTFEERISQLRAFFALHGEGTKVPKRYNKAPGLRKWLSTMRSEFKTLELGGDSTLSFGEIEALNSLDFNWRGKKAQARKRQASDSKANVSSDRLSNGSADAPRSSFGDSKIDAVANTRAQRDVDDRRDGQRSQTLQPDLKVSSRTDLKNPAGRTEKVNGSGVHHAVARPFNKATNTKGGTRDASKTNGSISRSTTVETHRGENGNVSKAKVPIKEEPTPNKKPDTSWGGRLKQLQEYKALNGNIDVPTVYEPDQAFANWVRTQSRLFGSRVRGLTDAISDERFNLLKDIGFGSPSGGKPAAAQAPQRSSSSSRSNRLDSSMESKIGRPGQKLAQGINAVTSKPALKDPPSSRDAPQQSHSPNESTVIRIKQEEAPPSRISQHDAVWGDRLQQLVKFRALNGHTRVPQLYATDQSFANWVKTQRRLFASRVRGLTDAMSDERFVALQNLGFEPSIPQAKYTRLF